MSFTSDLMMLANTGGGYRKQGALKSIWPDENIQWFFYQAMSPYIHFNMTMKMNDVIGEGDKEDPEEALIILIDRVQSGDMRGAIAKRELKKELSKYTVDFQRLIHRMINKELRMGVGPAVVNKVAPGFLPEFMVPLAHRVEWRKVAILAWYPLRWTACVAFTKMASCCPAKVNPSRVLPGSQSA